MKLEKYTGWVLPILLISFFLIFTVISLPYYSGDVENHVIWGRSILNEGASGFYSRDFHNYSVPNYPPISMFSFAAAVSLYDFIRDKILFLDNYEIFPSTLVGIIDSDNILISFLKLPAILPFILSGFIIYYLGILFKKKFKESLIYVLLFLLNPSFVYLAVIWGQNDFTQVLFMLGAFLLLLNNFFNWSIIFASLSILSKQTALLIWGLFLITVFKLEGISKFITGVFAAAILIWLLYFPFNNSDFLWPFAFYNESLRTTGLLVSDNAINFWGLLSRFQNADAQEVILNLKLEYWGYLFFLVLFVPILIKYLNSKFSRERLFYFLFLTSIIYFFTLTRMHERYIIFSVVFAHILVMISRKYWLNLGFFSLLMLLNLYRGLVMPNIPLLVDLANSIFVLTAFGISYFVIILLNYYYFMYRLKK